MQHLIHVTGKGQYCGEKMRFFPEISISCTSQEYNDVTTPYYPFSRRNPSSGCLLEVKNKGNFKLFALKMIAVPYKRWSLAGGSKYSDSKTFGIKKTDCIIITMRSVYFIG